MRVTGLKRNEVVSTTMFIGTLEDYLRARGEHGLAAMLIAAGQE